MRNSNVKRWVAGLCAATMLAGTSPMVGYAAALAPTKDLTNDFAGDSTSVEVNVADADLVSYVIQIPEKVDFGTIQQPNASGIKYVEQPITVYCARLDGLESGQSLAVLVKDSDAVEHSDPFKLKHGENSDAVLTYTIINQEGNDIRDLRWYENGFLFNAFTSAEQTATNTLKLDVGQLYGKDLAKWGGRYTGTLDFYSKIASISDVNP